MDFSKWIMHIDDRFRAKKMERIFFPVDQAIMFFGFITIGKLTVSWVILCLTAPSSLTQSLSCSTQRLNNEGLLGSLF